MTTVSSLTSRTMDFWHARTDHPITSEDARQMLSNVSGFFMTLARWDLTLTNSGRLH